MRECGRPMNPCFKSGPVPEKICTERVQPDKIPGLDSRRTGEAMSGYGKINLLGMLLLPAFATLAGIVMFGPRVDTMVSVFGMNTVPMLIGGLFSGLLLRSARKSGGVGRLIALWPTFIPAFIGISWYLGDALFPAEQDPGRVYLAGPQYLLVIAVLAGLCACTACAILRSRRAAA